MEWKKIKHYGKLSNRKDRIEFNYVSWDGSEKYDLRKWGDDGKVPYKGITIDGQELAELLKLLKIAKERKKSKTPTYTLKIQENEIDVLDVFGSFSTSGGWGKYVTYTSWGKNPKYDVRSWSTDFSQCGKGVTLSESELELLIALVGQIITLEKEISDTPKEIKDTVNNLSDDLLI